MAPTAVAQKPEWAGGTWTGECGATATIEATIELRGGWHADEVGVVAATYANAPKTTTLRCVRKFKHSGPHSAVPDGALSWSES